MEILFITVWICIAVYVFLHYFIILRLKSKHNEVWKLLGKPDLFKNNNNKTWKNVDEYMMSRKDVAQKDVLLSRAIYIIRILDKYKFSYIVSLFWVVYIFIIIVKHW